ncbi:MAG: Clp protease N-terminal domain-containing protein, partial [Fidelibacterota bacterium]
MILKIAKEEAIRLGHSYVGSEHLLLGIILDPNSKAASLLESIGVSLTDMHKKLTALLKPVGGTITLGHLPLTRRSETILRNTFVEAERLDKKVADDTHLLLAMTKESEGIAKEVLEDFNVDYDLLQTYLSAIESPDQINSPRPVSSTPTLDMFSRNFSKMAAEEKLDPVIGRSVEIERVAQILARRKKNNPVLIGEPGVGKTAIVEGLAIRIHNKVVPRILWGKRVLALDLAGLIAGTKYRGQFEERMQKVMMELEKTADVIIFIDELHTIVGAGAASGSLDAANMFKPALARGEIQVIGATTLNEY